MAIKLFLAALILLFSSCTNNIQSKNMFILMGDYYQSELSLIEISDKKIVDEYIVLDLTELKGPRVMQAGFISTEEFYVVFETGWRDKAERLTKVRIYDLSTLNFKDVFDYYHDWIGIGIVDVETSGAYFSSFRSRILYFLDFNEQSRHEIYEFSNTEEIIYINCRSDDKIISVNTFDKNENIYRYYFIDKLSCEKIVESSGQIFAGENNIYLINNNSKIYLVDDLVSPKLYKEVSIKNKKDFYRATGVYNNTFVLTYYTTTPMLWANFLFGGTHERNHYDYWLVTGSNNESDMGYFRIFKNNINFSNKYFFDAIILEDNKSN